MQHYLAKFVSDLRQVSGFLRVLWFPPPIKQTDRYYITEILLKVALNTITLTLSLYLFLIVVMKDEMYTVISSVGKLVTVTCKIFLFNYEHN